MNEFCNVVFVVTEAFSCPLHSVGEEFLVRNFTLSIRRDKQTCLLLLQEFMKVLAVPESLLQPQNGLRLCVNPVIPLQQGAQRVKFECTGCAGLLRFERKRQQKTQNVTVHGRLLEAKNREAEQRANELVRKKIYSFLRGTELFAPLDDNTLHYLAHLMQLRRHDKNKMLIAEGMPGTHFYILLAGQAAVMNKEGEIFAKLKRGDVFGETSLLTGRPAYPSVCSLTPVQLIVLNSSNFRQAISTCPHLNSFFWNIVMSRATANFIRSSQISSGMSGELACISLLDLFQLIHSSRKSGKIELVLPDGPACVLFNEEGEIIHADCGQLEGKEALFSLLTKKNGTFTYTAQLPKEGKNRQVLGGFMGLMMEGVQRLDEKTCCNESRMAG